ncbi:MAG TPA: EutN/CcmL family microcompartment protein [Bdellovibrionota bacterium]|nr:EutN/CcmL family microcompartment protein [Bdellovibrionota bacterium]
MHLGKVLGTVVATRKYKGLEGIKFYLLQPQDENGNTLGDPLVACDAVGARSGDEVMWVSSREASLALEEKFVPVDASIVGLVDDIHQEAVIPAKAGI